MGKLNNSLPQSINRALQRNKLPLSVTIVALLILPLTLFSVAHKTASQGRAQQKIGGFVKGQILIKFKSTTTQTAMDELMKAHNAATKKILNRLNVHVLSVPEGAEQAIVQALSHNPEIEYVETDPIAQTAFIPNDPYFNQQWGLLNTGQTIKGTTGTANADIHVSSAWDSTKGTSSTGSPTVVAVLDSGIDTSHPDLAGKVIASQNFTSTSTTDDEYGHGTHVAGIIAANTNNSTGVAGVCPDCKLLNVKVVDDSGNAAYSDIANGITWAADNGAKVINISSGAPSPSSTIDDAVNYAWNKGAIVIAAAGNLQSNTPFYPAASPNAIAVAATDSNDQMVSYSDYGSWVDLAAPGINDYSTFPTHSFAMNTQYPDAYSLNYGYADGTSDSAPYVSGTAGLVFATAFGSSNASVRDRLESQADKIAGTGTDWASGRVDAQYAVSPQIVRNSSFESGAQSWTQTSTSSYLPITNSSTYPAHTGSWYAWLAGMGSANTNTLSQQITIPAYSPTTTLSFYLGITTNESTTTNQYDKMTVQIKDASGNVLKTLATYSNLDKNSTYAQKTFDLSSYKGQTIQLFFQSTEDSSLQTSFLLDDITVTTTAQAASPTASPTPGDSVTPTPTTVPTNTPTPTPQQSTTTSQLLQNPGFESGNNGKWTLTSTTSDLPLTNSTTYAAHSGSWYAWLDGTGTTHTDTVGQTVSIPSTATAATLSFYLRVTTDESTTTNQYDTLKVQLRNSSGTVLTTLDTFSNLNKGSTYAQKSYNILSYKGQSVQVYFVGAEDSSLQTSFLIDDTAVSVTTPSSATPTPTGTSQPTSTPTVAPTANVSVDLSIPSFTLTDSSGNSKTSFAPGEAIYVKLSAKNSGTANSASGAITTIYRNSANAPTVSTASDISGGFQITHGVFGAGGSYLYCSTTSCSGGYANQFKNTSGTVVNSFAAPSTAGSYKAWAYVNYNNAVAESNTGNNTISASYTVVAPTPTATVSNVIQSQLLQNPGFESGTASWNPTSTTSNLPITNSTTYPARSGSWYAWFDGTGTNHTDTISQTVSIPSNATSANLSFYIKTLTDETNNTTAYDTLVIKVRDSSGNDLRTLDTFSNMNNLSSYTQKSYDLSAYKGQTIQIYFNGTEDSSKQTSFFVDDTALNVTQ